MRVVVIGAGLMGSQIGCEYALGGHEVAFVARRPADAERRIAGAFAVAGGAGLAAAEDMAAAWLRVTVVPELDAIPAPVELVVESVVEDPAVKAEWLGRAGAAFEAAVLASNTSSLSITGLGKAAGAPGRTIGTHYWNPPLLMPLVEVIRGEGTDPDVVARVAGWLATLGKRPVLVEQDVPGFVWNRLQNALLREAVWIVEHGVATPETVDEIVRRGLARRWRLTGPFATAALGGADTFERVARIVFPHLSHAEAITDLGRWLPEPNEELDALRVRRDAELAAELRRDRGEG